MTPHHSRSLSDRDISGYDAFHQLFYLSPDPSLLIRDRVIIACNDAAVNQLGFREERDLISQEFISLFFDPNLDRRSDTGVVDGYISEAERVGSAKYTGFIKRNEKQGEEREVTLTRIHSEEGTIIHAILHATSPSRIYPKHTDMQENTGRSEALNHEQTTITNLYEQIIASSPHGVLIFQADTGRCLKTNQVAATILGGSIEEIAEFQFRDDIFWRESLLLETAEDVLTSGQQRNLDVCTVSPFGKEIKIGCTLIPFTSFHHLHLLLLFDDISNQKTVETENHKRELILRSIARSARRLLGDFGLEKAIQDSLRDLGEEMKVDRVYIFENHLDPTSGLLLTSQKYEWASPGVEPTITNESLQKIPYIITPPWEEELSSGRIIAGLVENFNYPARELLEDQGIISILVVPIRIGDTFWGFIGFDDCHARRLWTITEKTVLKVAADIIGGAICRRKASDALIETKQQLMDIIEYLPDATMVISKDGVVTAWNRAMEELTGVRARDMLGKGEYQYSAPFYGNIRPMLADYALNPNLPTSEECDLNIVIDNTLSGETTITRENRSQHLSTRACLLRNQNGQVLGAIESIRDITWQIETEKQIRQYTRDLEEKNRDLGILSRSLIELNQDLDHRVAERTNEVVRLLEIKNDLITQIGHDLKTPLTPIIALLPEVLEHITDPETGELLAIIHRNADRLRKVVAMVLAYSRLEAVSAVVNPNGICLNEVFHQAFEDSLGEIRSKKLIVNNLIMADFRIQIAENHAQTIAMNLISNAVKFSLPYGEITAFCEKNEGCIRISVRDTGIGMTDEDCSRAFEEFYQADSSRHDRGSCGLGLAIVSKIVTMYEGTITAASEGVGKGSEIRITFPASLHDGESKSQD
jgi:signal transduction histidine kinase